MKLMDSAGKMSATPHAGGRIGDRFGFEYYLSSLAHVGDTLLHRGQARRAEFYYPRRRGMGAAPGPKASGSRRAGQGERVKASGSRRAGQGERVKATEAEFTFVAIDGDGRP